MNSILVSGAGGLVGSAISEFFLRRKFRVIGIENDSRKKFFGESASTKWRLSRLEEKYKIFENHRIDIASRSDILRLIAEVKPDATIHTAAQPSHDFAARNTFLDFDVNAHGTLNLLEACRINCPDTIFIHFSTNKVYGDSINDIPYVELESRYEFSGIEYGVGIGESQTIDQSTHSLFGVSKTYADLAVQEYGRNLGMKTTVLRGGCLTGPNHSAVEAHGFLSFLVLSAIRKKSYKIIGFKGKQVRDNLHVEDIAKLVECVIESPNQGEVFNLGGGYNNSTSIIEAAAKLKKDYKLNLDVIEQPETRTGDHRVYYTSNRKLHSRYPNWKVERDLDSIFSDLVSEWQTR